jgi:hypothetical protein
MLVDKGKAYTDKLLQKRISRGQMDEAKVLHLDLILPDR